MDVDNHPDAAITSKEYTVNNTLFPIWKGFELRNISNAVKMVEKLEIDNVFNTYSELCLQYSTLRAYYANESQEYYKEYYYYLLLFIFFKRFLFNIYIYFFFLTLLPPSFATENLTFYR